MFSISHWNKESRLILAICLSSGFMCIELVGGIWANSLAVLTDAAHLMTDVAGFVIALAATILAKNKATSRFSFGYARAEIIGAFISILTLWILTGWLLLEACERLYKWFQGTAEPVDGQVMTLIAVLGVVINLILAVVFQQEHEEGAFHSHGSHEHDHGHEHGSHGHDHHKEDHHNNKSSHNHHDHDHGHSHGGHESEHELVKLEQGKTNKHSCDDNNHDHDHDHDHDHGHDHGHQQQKHGHTNGGKEASTSPHETANLLAAGAPYQNSDEVDHHHHGHDHGHDALDYSNDSSSSAKVSKDLNMSAAYAHVISDLIQSVGVVIAGVIIWYKPHWQVVDPICTFIFGFLVLNSTRNLMTQVMEILFEGVPSHINYEDIKKNISSLPLVDEVHDLHIWSLSSHMVCLSCHIKVKNTTSSSETIVSCREVCRRHGIHHVTIQVESTSECPTSHDGNNCAC